MGRVRNLSVVFLLGLLAISPLGCGGGDDGGTTPPPGGSLDGVTLASSSSAPGGKIQVEGLPSTKTGEGIEAAFFGPDGTEIFRVPVETADGEPWFLAPFHPLSPADGGAITLRIASSGAASPDLALDLGALPPATGSFAIYVDLLRAHIDQRAVAEGSSFTELAAQGVGEVDMRLLPLKFAQVFVDDPAHPHSLADIADGSSDYLDTDQRDILDRIFGYAPIDSVVQADIDHMTGAPTTGFIWYGTGKAGKGCVNMGPTVSTAPQLSEAMKKAFAAKIATDPNGAPAQILGATGLALGAAAFVPALGGVAAVAGAGLYAYQTSREYIANTYPSSFVRLDFDLDRAILPEDEPDFAQWSNVQVIAKSNGWVADKAVFDAIMQLVGAGLGAAGKGKIQESEFLRDAALNDLGMSVGFYLEGQPEGVVEFCSQQWGVDITDLPYSEGSAVIGRMNVDTQWRQIRPAMVGEDIIRVRAVKEEFGFQTISADRSIETKAIQVVASPNLIKVKNPGEVVAITATIENADLETLDWQPEQGTWQDGSGNATNGPGTRPLKTPDNKDLFPFDVVVESLSRQGLRESGEPRRRDAVTVDLERGKITVDPPYACVAQGETETFSATVDGLENETVMWSLEPVSPGGSVTGSISPTTGVYQNDGAGTATMLVVATSEASPEVKGYAELDAGACQCSWTLTIDTDGVWAGDFAAHSHPQLFPEFNLSFGWIDNNEDGLGSIKVLQSPPTPGSTGSWPCTFSFITSSQGWAVALDDEETHATLTIYENNGHIRAEISGTALTAIAGEGYYRGFNMTVRSDDLFQSDNVCGAD